MVESAVKPKKEMASPPVQQAPAQPLLDEKRAPIAKRLEDFLIDLGTDPKARILALDQFGKPSKHDQFHEAPLSAQRVVTLRVLIVDEPRQ